MAEETFITNVKGELGVASEVTLRKLLEEMQKMARQSGRDPNSQEARVRENLRKSLLGEIEVVDDVTDSMKSFGKSLALAPLRVFAGGINIAANATGKLAGSVTGFGKEILAGSERLEDFTQHLPLVGKYLAGIAGQLDSATDSYRQLTAVGASFNNSIIDMYKASIDSAMGFERFNELILENSNRMNFFSGTVSGGAREIGRLSKQMREGDTANALFNMGFTIEDISEALINYTQLQAMTTGRRIRDENTLIQGTQAYLEEINKLAKITGLNRKEQEQIMLQNMQEANVAVMRSKLQGDALNNFDSSLKHMAAKFPEYTAAFKDLMDGIPQTELGAKLASLVPGFSDLAQAAARGEITQEEFDKRIREIAPRFKELADQFGPAGITALMQNGFGEFFDGMFRISEYTSKVFDPKAAEEEAKRREAITGALTQFSNVVNQIRTGLFNAFIDSGFFKNMETFFTETFTSEKIDKFSEDIATFMNAFVKDPSGTINEMFQNMKTYLYDAIFGKSTFDEFGDETRKGGLIETLSNGFKNLFKDDGVISALKQGIADATKAIGDGFTDFWNSPESQTLRNDISGLFRDLIHKMEEIFVNSWLARTFLGIDREEVAERQRTLKGDATAESAKNFSKLINQAFNRGFMFTDVSGILEKELSEIQLEGLQKGIEENQSSFLRSILGPDTELRVELRRLGDLVESGDATQEQLNLLKDVYNAFREGGFIKIPSDYENKNFNAEVSENVEKFNTGTKGFQDFGKGTLAMLHGREAVVREDSEMGQLLKFANNLGIPWQKKFMAQTQTSAMDYGSQTQKPNLRNTSGIEKAIEQYKQRLSSLDQAQTPNFSGISGIEKAIEQYKQRLSSLDQEQTPNFSGISGIEKAIEQYKQRLSSLDQEQIPNFSGITGIEKAIEQYKQRLSSLDQAQTSTPSAPRLPVFSEIKNLADIIAKEKQNTTQNAQETRTVTTMEPKSPVVSEIENLSSILNRMEEKNTKTGINNTELQKQLNSVMNDTKAILGEMKEISKKIETNTRSLGTNVASGYVTSVR